MWSLQFNEQAYENDLFDLKEGVMPAAIPTSTIIQDLGHHFKNAGNALERVQRVHEPADLWDITFWTRWFWGL